MRFDPKLPFRARTAHISFTLAWLPPVNGVHAPQHQRSVDCRLGGLSHQSILRVHVVGVGDVDDVPIDGKDPVLWGAARKRSDKVHCEE